jgi:hypothetical protein
MVNYREYGDRSFATTLHKRFPVAHGCTWTTGEVCHWSDR